MYSFKKITESLKQMANGQRNTALVPLTDAEIQLVKKEIIAIGAEKDMNIFIFNDKKHVESPLLGTGYDPIDDVIYITKNIFPDTQYGSIHPRDLMSIRAVLAHEYYGHRPYRNEYLADIKKGNNYHTTPIWQDECRASINASKLAPNLSHIDKVNLIQDAVYRAKEYHQYIEMDDYMIGVIYGYENIERPITPNIKPLRFVSESSVDRIHSNGDDNNNMPQMQYHNRCDFER